MNLKNLSMIALFVVAGVVAGCNQPEDATPAADQSMKQNMPSSSATMTNMATNAPMATNSTTTPVPNP